MKNILIIGAGRFGSFATMKLHDLGHQTLVIDKDESRINRILPHASEARIGDSTDEAFMKTIGVHSYDVCLVSIGDDFLSSLQTTFTLSELGAKKVIARATSSRQEKFLLRNGADEVIYPEKQLAQWAAIRYSSEHILDYIELDGEHAVLEVNIPEQWLGKTVIQLDIRKKYNLNIMGFRQGEKLSLVVTPDTVLTEDKTLMVLGRLKDIQKCFKI